jgi:flagellar protein FlgJ
MDAAGLGSLYLDNARFTTPAAFNAPAGSSPGEAVSRKGGTFAEVLEAARASQETQASQDAQASQRAGEGSPADAEGNGAPGKKAVVDKTDKLYEQCEALESFLIKTLINSMRSTVQKTGLIEEGFAGKMYEDMLYDEYAKDFTKNAGFGLAEMAYLELTGQRGKISPDRL